MWPTRSMSSPVDCSAPTRHSARSAEPRWLWWTWFADSGSRRPKPSSGSRASTPLRDDLERPRNRLAAQAMGAWGDPQAVLARRELVAVHAAGEVDFVAADLVLVGEAADYDEASAGADVAIARGGLAAALSLAAPGGRFQHLEGGLGRLAVRERDVRAGLAFGGR